MHGDRGDLRRIMRIHEALNMGGADDDRLPVAWAIVFAFGIGAAAGVAGWLAWQVLSAIDWQTIMQFDTWLGSTGRNIGSLFAAAKEEGPCILFIDEFDALAPARRNGAQAAQVERNASVNVLLQRIEQHDGIIIAATNFSAEIDQAIWRRFDIQIELALPGLDERRRILARYLLPYGLPSAALSELAESMSTASPSLMRQFCEALKRNIVLGDRLGWDMRRAATIDRILAGLQPHKDLGRPRLWALGSGDRAISMLPWPLPIAADVVDEPAAEPPHDQGSEVIPFAVRADK